MLRAPLPTTLNDNLAIHSNDSFWIVQKDQASLSAVRLTTPRRPVQTGRLRPGRGYHAGRRSCAPPGYRKSPDTCGCVLWPYRRSRTAWFGRLGDLPYSKNKQPAQLDSDHVQSGGHSRGTKPRRIEHNDAPNLAAPVLRPADAICLLVSVRKF